MKAKKLLSATLALTMLFTGSISNVGAVYASTRIEQGPGPNQPLAVKELGDFKTSEGWKIIGATQTDAAEGGTFKLTSTSAAISKEFTYPTWDYSDLAIKVKNLSEGMTWSISVKGSEKGSKDMVIQEPSKYANSQFGESFTYSLEGIAGAEPMSNWNDETVANKTFTLTLTLTGKVNDEITLAKLNASKPNYTIPEALPSNVKGTIGGVNFDGDPKLDVDTLKNDDANAAKEHQYISLPKTRLVVFNAGSMTVDNTLDLKFGVYYGIKRNTGSFQTSTLNAKMTIDGTALNAGSLKTAWYPHKLERSASVANKGTVATTDFMVDDNTVGRIVDFDAVGTSNLNIATGDDTANGLKSSWYTTNDANVVVKTDSLTTGKPKNLFYQAMKVIALNADGSYNKELTETIQTPANGVGNYVVPSTVKKVGIAIGYANREEGLEKAVERALKNTVNGNLVKSYENTKKFWDETLRKAPVPKTWGVQDKNIKDYNVVTEDKHRVLYYSGYVHNLINTLGVTPETGYAYTQQALGIASRQSEGACMTPANNSWEGLLQIQNIMYMDPSVAWSGMEGFMSMVDANGFLNGEVLPVRMAQTIWMVHSISPDIARLQAMYPALSRHLKYKISDPRWQWGNERTQNEIDQEYITSWLNDVVYMIEICKELGGEYAKEVAYWEAEYDKALANYADWFFSDPMSHEAKGSYPQDGSGVKNLRNGAGLPDANYQRGMWTRIFHINGDVTAIKDSCATNTDEGPHYAHSNKGGHSCTPAPGRYPREWLQVILAGLVVKDIPTKEAQQLEQFFIDVNNPANEISGLENLKWAPASLLIYGLINRGYYAEAKNQLDAYLVKSIQVWQFCENYTHGTSNPGGTAPTSFGASQIIEATMLRNGVINDGSGVKAIENWDKDKNQRVTPKIYACPEIEIDLKNPPKLEELKLPKEIKQVYNRVNVNGEKFTVNKMTAVEWDIKTLRASGKDFLIDGITETYDKVTATITDPFITGFDKASALTEQGLAPTLPKTVNAIIADGSKKEVAVKWDAIDASKYAQPGTFEVNGTVEGTTIKAVCEVEVLAKIEGVDRKPLFEAISKASAIEKGTYTQKSFDNLQNAIATAEGKILTVKTEADVTKAVADLEAYINNLTDKTPALEVLAKYDALNPEDYTVQSFNTLKTQCNNLRNGLENYATPASMNTIINNINRYMTNLVSIKELGNLIKTAEAIDLDKYTGSSAQKLGVELYNAKKVYTTTNATQVTVDNAVKALQAAIDGLVPLPAPTFTVTFMSEGKEYAKVETKFGEDIVMPENPTKDGYNFVGWFDAIEGGKEVTAFYKTQTVFARFEKIVPTITEVTIKELPAKTEYYTGDALDVTGGKLEVKYSDGTVKVVHMTADMVSGYDAEKVGKQTITVTYEEHTVTFEVTVKESIPWTPIEPSEPIDPEEPDDSIPWTPIEPSTPIDPEEPDKGIDWTPLEPAKPIEKEEKPDTGDNTSVVMVAGTLMLAAAGMVLLRKKKED